MRQPDFDLDLAWRVLEQLAQPAPAGTNADGRADPRADALALASVRGRLAKRVRRSAEAHREYLTLRHEAYRWLPVAPGVQEQLLRRDTCVRVLLWRLAPGTALPRMANSEGLELLVVQGRLQGSGSACLETNGYLTLTGRDLASLSDWRAPEAALIYLRSRHGEADRLPALEQHWWRLAATQSGQVQAKNWLTRDPLVKVMPLCGDASVRSMLVRFEPDGAVPDHCHALDEDCLVLQGEMFLGDILLRALDYQLAPAGGSHFGETSDVGVSFFFHGAIDPVLSR